MKKNKYPESKTADIAIISEGSYPFIKGGVATWVHQLIQLFPQYQFAVIFLGSLEKEYQGLKYDLPKNVVHFKPYYLYDEESHYLEKKKKHKASKTALVEIKKLHQWFKESIESESDINTLNITKYIQGEHSFGLRDFLFSHESWNYILEMYDTYCTDPSFIDYFWTIRNIHMPIWKIAKLISEIPQIKLVHSVSTGYAGFLGTLIKENFNCAFILTEHGIYTKERRIDLLQSSIIKRDTPLRSESKGISYLRNLWIKFFESISKFCYASADPIISLYQGAQNYQIKDGANPKHTIIIPNAINIDTFKPLRKKSTDNIPPILALIGRVVPLKDIKTFIFAINIILTKLPQIEGWIIGPYDEDPEYYNECLHIINSLNIKDKIKFTGVLPITEILPKIGITVLSSISEGMPLVVLESFAAGIPCILTDVGSCRELIQGNTSEDKALGDAGYVIEIANPDELASAAISLFTDTNKRQSFQKAAINRVEKFYSEEKFIESYHQIYQRELSAWQG